MTGGISSGWLDSLTLITTQVGQAYGPGVAVQVEGERGADTFIYKG